MAKERRGLKNLMESIEQIPTAPAIPPATDIIRREQSQATESQTKPQENGTLSRNNLSKLNAALEHLRKQFHDAAGLQVGGRNFFGRTVIEITWENSEAQEIQPETSARDRVVRSGR